MDMTESQAARVKAYKRRAKKLLEEREKMVPLWKDLRTFINPERFEFDDESLDNGDDLYASIYNNTPLLAAGTESSGLMTHHTSPSTIWFQLEIPDLPIEKLDREGRIWLVRAEAIYMLLFARSNVYTRMLELYEDLVTPGTGVFFLESDREDGLRGWTLPCGTYALAAGANGRVNTLYRWLTLTVGQLVERFGREACSQRVRELFDRGEMDLPRKVLHVVEPRTARNPEFWDNQNMPWASCWIELEGSDVDGLLRESGFRACPFMAPRWGVFAGSVYGRSSAMRALGDAKELQHLSLKKAQIVEKLENPAMTGPAELDNRPVDFTPGGFTSLSGDGRVTPAYVPDRQALAEVRLDIEKAEQRIYRAFHADLFRLLVDDDRANNKTAEEIRAKSQERMTQLGPVLERLNDEWLDPFFDRVFDIVMELKLLPEPPESLQGREIRVSYISVLASAQRMLRTTSLERMVQFILMLSQTSPDVAAQLRAKVDFDAILDLYAEMVGVDPRSLKSADEVAKQRDADRKAMEQQMAAEQLQTATAGVKNLAQSPVDSGNALGAMLGSLGPIAGAANPTGEA